MTDNVKAMSSCYDDLRSLHALLGPAGARDVTLSAEARGQVVLAARRIVAAGDVDRQRARQMAVAAERLAAESRDDDPDAGWLARAQLRDLTGRELRERHLAQLDDVSCAARLLLDATAGQPERAAADLLTVSVSTLQRWAADGRATPHPRASCVARCVFHLRHGMTAAGVIAWWDHPRWELGGRTPRAMLDELPDSAPALVALASGSREMVAA